MKLRTELVSYYNLLSKILAIYKLLKSLSTVKEVRELLPRRDFGSVFEKTGHNLSEKIKICPIIFSTKFLSEI